MRAAGQQTNSLKPPCHMMAATQSTMGAYHTPMPTINHQLLLPSLSLSTTHTKATGHCTNHPESPCHMMTMTSCPTAGIYHPAGYTPTHFPWMHNPHTHLTTTDTMQQMTTMDTSRHGKMPMSSTMAPSAQNQSPTQSSSSHLHRNSIFWIRDAEIGLLRWRGWN